MWRSLIYPIGRVHPHYNTFVKWSLISNICISAESVLSTHSMLSALNINNNSMNMSYNYVGKDIIGQIGGMIYINKFAKQADQDPKRFIKYSMIIQQTSTLLECATPILPLSLFLPFGSMANIGKNISFAGFGAINAKIIQKLAVDNNIGEIYAKLTVINTFGSTLGMSLGLLIASIFPDHGTRLIITSLFGIIRYYSYFKATNKFF